MELQFDYAAKSIDKSKTDCLILFLPTNLEQATGVDQLAKAVQRSIEQLYELKDFSGKQGQSQTLFPGTANLPRLLLIGIGDVMNPEAEFLRRAAGKAGQLISKMKVSQVSLIPPVLPKNPFKTQIGTFLSEGLTLGAYQFNHYKNSEDESTVKAQVTVFDVKKTTNAKSVQSGLIRANGANLARDLGNTAPNDLNPTSLAEKAEQVCQEHGLDFEVLEEEEMRSMGMDMLLGVSHGSKEPAKLIIMKYNYRKNAKTVVLVGKGITFDAGGISLKPGKGMEEMKFDMCGAGAVLGSMQSIASLRPKVNVIALIPAAENMPGGSAQRPGDIVKSYSGKTVEVINTDAEGRLVLGDAMTYAVRTFNPDAIFDIATLTGACVIALGHHASALISNSDEVSEKVVAAGKSSGDRVWPMPDFPEYEEGLKGKYADLLNVGPRAGGTITAGLFLKNFVEDVPWGHIDIAGTAWDVKGNDTHPNSGATGVGVRLFLDLLENW